MQFKKIHKLGGKHNVHRVTVRLSESECAWIETENKMWFAFSGLETNA